MSSCQQFGGDFESSPKRAWMEAAKMAAAKKRGEKEENETCCSKKDKGLEKRIIRQWKFSGGKKVLSWDFRELAKTRLTGFWTHIKK